MIICHSTENSGYFWFPSTYDQLPYEYSFLSVGPFVARSVIIPQKSGQLHAHAPIGALVILSPVWCLWLETACLCSSGDYNLNCKSNVLMSLIVNTIRTATYRKHDKPEGLKLNTFTSSAYSKSKPTITLLQKSNKDCNATLSIHSFICCITYREVRGISVPGSQELLRSTPRFLLGFKILAKNMLFI